MAAMTAPDPVKLGGSISDEFVKTKFKVSFETPNYLNSGGPAPANTAVARVAGNTGTLPSLGGRILGGAVGAVAGLVTESVAASGKQQTVRTCEIEKCDPANDPSKQPRPGPPVASRQPPNEL